MKHIMVDLETWGTKPYSTILSIGAAYFIPEHGVQQTFGITIDPVDSEKRGFRKDAETIGWWLQPAQNEAWAEWHNTLHFEAFNAFHGFSLWIEQLFDLGRYPGAHDDIKVGNRDTFSPFDHVCVWGNGATFDNTLLRQGFELLNMEPPWKHYNDRCFRTLKNLSAMRPTAGGEEREFHAKEFSPPHKGQKHNAVVDAIQQAEWLCNIVQEFNLKLG